MRPSDHLILGGAAGAALYPAIGADSLLFWAASVAIDLDHYLDYVYMSGFKDFSVKRMFEYHRILNNRWRDGNFLNIEVFHTVEFMAPLFFLADRLNSTALYAACLGLLFHALIDVAHFAAKGAPFIRAHSFIEYFIRKRLLEKKGLRPTEPYVEASRRARLG